MDYHKNVLCRIMHFPFFFGGDSCIHDIYELLFLELLLPNIWPQLKEICQSFRLRFILQMYPGNIFPELCGQVKIVTQR